MSDTPDFERPHWELTPLPGAEPAGADRSSTTHSALRLEVVIEVPRWGFLKRGSSGRVDFVSPLPCPYNYGSVPEYMGLDGDLLDALVLGRRLARGTRLTVFAFGAVGLTDRGMYDDKLICGREPPSVRQRSSVLRFFHFYAHCKGLLNRYRRRPGPTRCEGWGDARAALALARRPDQLGWQGPSVPF